MSSFDDETIIMSGYLQKKSKYLSKTRSRWMVLTSDCLYSYKNKKEYDEPTETFDLIIYDKIDYEPNINNTEFELMSSKTNDKRIFIAETHTQMLAWIRNIKKLYSDYIIVPINAYEKSVKFKPFSVRILYSNAVQINDLLTKAIKKINQTLHPKMYYIEEIEQKSFIGELEPIYEHENDKWNDTCSKSLTEFEKDFIQSTGLNIHIENKFTHKSTGNNITCKYIKWHQQNITTNDDDDDEKQISKNILNHSYNPLNCPIYESMKIHMEYTEQNLQHLIAFEHFKDKFKDRSACKDYAECKSYIKFKDDATGIDMEDKCHMEIYRHPPRTDRQMKLSQSITEFMANTSIWNTKYEPNFPLLEKDSEKWAKKDGYLEELIAEIIDNGFRYDLCLACSISDICRHSDYSVLKIVDQKLHSIRHKQMGNPLNRAQMLSLVLYARSSNCNYDLCETQRNGDYEKWKWFDCCLYSAILALNAHERASYKLYSGLSSIKLHKHEILNAYFSTYISCSWIKNISFGFLNENEENGMIIEFDEKVRERFECCDISWISTFPNECEVVIARTIEFSGSTFDSLILDEQNDIQTILLTYNVFNTVSCLSTYDNMDGDMEDDGGLETIEEVDYDVNEDGAHEVNLWLKSIEFGKYFNTFIQNGFDSMELVQEINDRSDLNDIGITLKAHQIALMNRINKLKNEMKNEKLITVDNID